MTHELSDWQFAGLLFLAIIGAGFIFIIVFSVAYAAVEDLLVRKSERKNRITCERCMGTGQVSK